MKTKGLVLLIACCVLFAAMSVGAEGAKQSSKIPIQNRGTPLPASWDDYPWEIQHVVKQGEFLFMLAGFYYMDGNKWNWIYEINSDKIKKSHIIKPGQVLTIRVPRDWEPPMAYRTWYERTREQFASGATGAVGGAAVERRSKKGGKRLKAGPGYNEGPEGYADDEPAAPAGKSYTDRARAKNGAGSVDPETPE